MNYSPGRFSQLFSGASADNSPAQGKSQGSQSAWSIPSAPQGKPATPQHKQSGLLTQLSALNSEKQELAAQLEAAQATVLEYKAESEAAGKEGAEANAEAARLQAQVKLQRLFH